MVETGLIQQSTIEQRIRNAYQTLPNGGTRTIQKSDIRDDLPDEFDVSILSFPKGANLVYRDNRDERTLQIREYDDRYELQMDRHNPAADPIEHFQEDVPSGKQAAMLIGGAVVVVGAALIFG
jgi:hypothetical protein